MFVEQTDYVVVQPLRGHVARQPVHVVRDVTVGVVVQEEFAGLVGALASRLEKRRLLLRKQVRRPVRNGLTQWRLDALSSTSAKTRNNLSDYHD